MLRSRISNWHYVYVLQSLKDKDFYIGYTTNPTARLKQHNAKTNLSTKSRTPFKYIYIEACLSEVDAKRREEYLKTTQGGRLLKLRLREFLRDAA
ncbi:MAG: GIY-YIG nuclease family protein [Candidatus Staskawiczbacteria bacterium]|nr:GIY-YIG nuclease family protein [Candidatus Staskawiczbacteria bacterium]